MLPASDIERFLVDLSMVCARHGVTVIDAFDGKVSAIMRGHPIDLTDGRLARLMDDAIRSQDAGSPSPETFF